MLLFSRLLSWRGPWNEISCRSVQTGGLGGGGGGWHICIGIWKTTAIMWVFVSLSSNFRTITEDRTAPHLAGMCPLFLPPALFLNLGRLRLARRLQCYSLQAEWGRPLCWPLKPEQEGLQPWLLTGQTEQLRAEMEAQVPAWPAALEWLGQGAGHLMTAPAALLVKAVLQL